MGVRLRGVRSDVGFVRNVWEDDRDAYDLRGCRWILWKVVRTIHGGELQGSEIPFGDISVCIKSLAMSYLAMYHVLLNNTPSRNPRNVMHMSIVALSSVIQPIPSIT